MQPCQRRRIPIATMQQLIGLGCVLVVLLPLPSIDASISGGFTAPVSVSVDGEQGDDNEKYSDDEEISVDDVRRSSDAASDVDSDSYTFADPGRSYVEYLETDVDQRTGSSFRLEFEFRTQLANAFLLRRGTRPFPAEDRSRSVGNDDVVDSGRGRRTDRRDLWVQLKIGMLYVSAVSRDTQRESPYVSISVGRDLNDDQWHRVQITVDDVTGSRLNATVDDRDHKSVALRHADVTASNDGAWQQQQQQQQQQQTIISVGGFSFDHQSSDVARSSLPFIGCFRGLRTTTTTTMTTTTPTTILQPRRTVSVSRGCRDLCQLVEHRCSNGGRCANHYASSTCDCYGTGFEGPRCDSSDVESLTVHGTDWLTVSTASSHRYIDSSAVSSRSTRIALQFKTLVGEGVLFHSTHRFPRHGFLELSLQNATLHVSSTSVNQAMYSELLVYLGSKLDDNRWHRVLVIYKGKMVEVSLDGHVERMTLEQAYWRFRMSPTVFFGGATGNRHSNFIGCLRELYFNDVDVLENLRRTSSSTPAAPSPSSAETSLPTPIVNAHRDAGSFPGSRDSVRTVYRDSQWASRPVRHGCHGLQASSVQLTRVGSWLQVGHDLSDALRMQFVFKTLKPSGVLTATAASVSSITQQRGIVQLALIDGRLTLDINVPDSHQMSLGNRLDDGSWHSVRLLIQNGFAEVEVDQLRLVEFIHSAVEFGHVTFVGGEPGRNVSDASFVGCVKLVQLQNADVDPLRLMSAGRLDAATSGRDGSTTGAGTSWAGVTIGDCDDNATAWCHRPSSVPSCRSQTCRQVAPARHDVTCDCGDTERRKHCAFFAMPMQQTVDSRTSFVNLTVNHVFKASSVIRNSLSNHFLAGEQWAILSKKPTVFFVLASLLVVVSLVAFTLVAVRRYCLGVDSRADAVDPARCPAEDVERLLSPVDDDVIRPSLMAADADQAVDNEDELDLGVCEVTSSDGSPELDLGVSGVDATDCEVLAGDSTCFPQRLETADCRTTIQLQVETDDADCELTPMLRDERVRHQRRSSQSPEFS